MRHRTHFLLIAAATAFLATATSAQIAAPPPPDSLAAITARGRALQQYDIASWHGTDAVGALRPKDGEINAGVTQQLPSGRWELLFGRLTAAKDTFYVVYRAWQTNDDSAFSAEKLATPRPEVGVLREKAVAMETATAAFGRVTRPYNGYLFPAVAGGFWIYLIPAQTDSHIYPIGGDVRYRITGGTTIAEQVRLHNAVLDRALPAGPPPVAMIHTHFDTPPSETDVFLVLRRFPRVPELIATKDFNYQVAVDGTISWRAAKNGQ